MSSIGIEVRIDVSKIDKARLYQGAKGNYLTLTTFVNLDEKDQYDNNGFVCQSSTKEERDSGLQMPILGNVKVFYAGGQRTSGASNANQAPPPAPTRSVDPTFIDDQDLPF